MSRSLALGPVLWLLRRACPLLCLMLVARVSTAQTHDARVVHDAEETAHRARDGRPDARPDAQPRATPEPTAAPSPARETPSRDEGASEPADGSSAYVQGQDPGSFTTLAPRSRSHTRAQARLAGLAVMAARVANQANLTATGTFEAPRDMGNSHERRVLLRHPEPVLPAFKPEVAPPPASVEGLDDGIVKEIGQRKTMFRMCYESARRRSVMVTRADVRWILSPDGSVRDVVVEVAQDEILARCIRVIASRPFSATLSQEIPVAIPLLFVSGQ